MPMLVIFNVFKQDELAILGDTAPLCELPPLMKSLRLRWTRWEGGDKWAVTIDITSERASVGWGWHRHLFETSIRSNSGH